MRRKTAAPRKTARRDGPTGRKARGQDPVAAKGPSKSRHAPKAQHPGGPQKPKRHTRDDRHDRSDPPAHRPPRARAETREARPDHRPHAQARGASTVQTLATSDFSQQLKAAPELLRKNSPPRVSEWLWTTRQGSERDLVEELLIGKDLRPRGFLPALVISERAPVMQGERLDVTFARQGFKVLAVENQTDPRALVRELAPKLHLALGGATQYALHVFVPDSDAGNLLAQGAQVLDSMLARALGELAPDASRILELGPHHASVPVLQVCRYEQASVACGVIASDHALSSYAGGRARMRLSGDFPSRAARKLEEAFAWLGVSPGPSELCVDLGAAPGGWSYVLLARKARVIAVDPARMDPKLQQDKRLRHIQGDAFKFTPDEPVDWLFCDMVWRPIEVAQMLGRWARKHQTRMLVANFKLPMKRKVEQVDTLRRTLAAAGFTAIRTRQLYHDRDEITLAARVR